MKVLRWLLSLAVLGLLLWALASWWLGKHIEFQVRLGHTQLSEQLGIPVELQHYKRGWLTSEAHSHIRLGHTADALTLNVHHHIAHGPLPNWRKAGFLSATSKALLTPKAKALPSTSSTQGFALQIESHLGIDRRLHIALTGQPSRFTDASAGMWEFRALQGQLTLAPELRSISAEFEWGGMQWSGPDDAHLAIGAMALNSHYQLPNGREALYDGHSEFQLAQMAIRNIFAPANTGMQPVPYAWQVDGLTWSNHLRTRTAIGQASASLQADATEFDGMHTGPVHWAMSVDAIDVQKLAQLMPHLGVWLNQRLQLLPVSVQALTVAQQQATQDGIAALFQQGLRLQLERASVALPAGEVQLEGHLTAPQLSGMDLSFLPLSLAPKVDLSVRARMPAAVAKDLQGSAAFQTLLAQGWWQRDGPSVHTHLRYQRGASTINGMAVQAGSLMRWLGQ